MTVNNGKAQPWFSKYEYRCIMDSITRNEELKCYVLNTSQFSRWARQDLQADYPLCFISLYEAHNYVWDRLNTDWPTLTD